MTTHTINYGFNDFTCGDYIFAIYSGDTAEVKRLLVAGQDPFETDSGGNSPFFWASFRGNVEIIRAIANAQIERGGVSGLVGWHLGMALPLLKPLDQKQMDRFTLLYDLVPDRQNLETYAPTLLGEAVFPGLDTEVVRFLIEKGVPPTGRRKPNGNTPLHDAAQNGRPDLMRRLLEAKPELNALNQAGESPLRVAINAVLASGVQGAAACVALLKEAGAQAIPSLGWTERARLWTRLKT